MDEQQLNRSVLEKYVSSNQSSKLLYDKARKVLPGGSTRTVLFFRPYPFYARFGRGSRIWDVDDNERIDFCFNYSVLILGHNNRKVNQAIQNQLSNGTSLGAPTELEAQLAEKIIGRLSSTDKVRFITTGTEAVMNAVRLARAYTKRNLIAKFEGAFHGTYDDVWVSVSPAREKAGNDESPNAVPECSGIPNSTQNCLVLPFNDIRVVENIILKHKDELAAVLIEPVLGVAGAIPPKKDFLRQVKEICSKFGIIVIFDEIVTGFRLSAGGAQKIFNIEPDITTFGKVAGGGMPIGGVASTNEIMKLYDIPQDRKPDIPLSGTFNGHPLTLAAGLAVLDQLDSLAYDHLNTLGDLTRAGLSKVFSDYHEPVQVTGIGSLFDIHFSKKEIVDYRSTYYADKAKKHFFELALLNHGVYLTHLHWNNLSLSTTRKEVDKLVEAAGFVLEEGMPGRAE